MNAKKSHAIFQLYEQKCGTDCMCACFCMLFVCAVLLCVLFVSTCACRHLHMYVSRVCCAYLWKLCFLLFYCFNAIYMHGKRTLYFTKKPLKHGKAMGKVCLWAARKLQFTEIIINTARILRAFTLFPPVAGKRRIDDEE